MKKMRFTLLELLISLSVFIVIFAILLKFVATGQQLWRGMEKKNDTYATARVTMNVIEQLLDDVVAGGNYAPFVPSSGSSSQLCFLTRSPLLNQENGTTSAIYAVKFAADSNHRLVLTYTNTGVSTYLKHSSLANAFSFPNATSTKVELSDYVTGFSVDVVTDAQTVKYTSGFTKGEANQIPRGIVVTVKTLNREDFEIWNGLSGTDKSNFASRHEMVFSRTCALPEVSRDLSQL